MKLGGWVFGVLLWAGCQPLPSKSALFDPDGDGSPWGEDCDNGNAAVYPAATDATLDGYDQNCDGVDGTDADRDGYASEATGGTDCADGDAAISPGAGETPYDGVDNDCDSATPDDDLDADGYGVAEDCADQDAAVHPGATEVVYDGLDNDCDRETLDDDLDGDGYLLAEDCDDADAAVNPGVVEVPYDGVDNDCDGGTPDDDLDGDGFGVAEDCDDGSPATWPGADEQCGDGVVSDCDHSVGWTIDACSGAMSVGDVETKLFGGDPWDRAGASVALTGDVTGDGRPDLLVGAYGEDAGGGDAGATYLISGDVSGIVDINTAAIKLVGSSVSEFVGFSVSDAGDVNQDGLSDLLSGTPLNDERGISAGVAFLVFGGTNGTVAANVSLFGSEAYDFAGCSVAGAGDVDADGAVDLLVGAYGADGGSLNSGVAYIVRGQASRTSGDFSLAEVGVALLGEDADDQAGWSVAGAGDTNGDGAADILVGAPQWSAGAPEAGAAYMILGGAIESVYLNESDLTLVGEQTGDRAGSAVAGAGDVDGDGHTDLIVGAPGAEDYAGAAYLVLGGLGGLGGQLRLSEATVKLTGEASGDEAGCSVSSAGDVDGDGFDDLIVGASRESSVGSGAGAAYLVLGSALEAQGGPASASLGEAAAKLLGESQEHWVGGSVSGGRDVDGDGRDDLLVGASGDGGNGTNSGAAYLITAASLF